MNKTIFMSRTVSEEGFYQVDFNTLGIFLTKISKEETNEIPYTHWVYMVPFQYIEGNNINSWCKKQSSDLSIKIEPTHTCNFTEYQGLFETGKFCSCGKQSN